MCHFHSLHHDRYLPVNQPHPAQEALSNEIRPSLDLNDTWPPHLLSPLLLNRSPLRRLYLNQTVLLISIGGDYGRTQLPFGRRRHC